MPPAHGNSPPEPDQGKAPAPRPRYRQRHWKPSVAPKGPATVACTRCGADAGVACNPQTLGKHQFHKARIDAWEASRSDLALNAEDTKVIGDTDAPSVDGLRLPADARFDIELHFGRLADVVSKGDIRIRLLGTYHGEVKDDGPPDPNGRWDDTE